MRRPALSLLLELTKAIADEDVKGAKDMFDWNGNGREDWGDHYIDYEIYKDVTGGNDDEPGGSSGEGAGCGCLLLVIIAVLISSMF